MASVPGKRYSGLTISARPRGQCQRDGRTARDTRCFSTEPLATPTARAIEAHACYRLRLAEWAREQGLFIVDAMRAVDAERARSGSAP
jgi:hypothetical protein